MQVWWIRCYLDNASLVFLDGELTFEQTYKGNAVVMHRKVKTEYYKYRDLQSQEPQSRGMLPKWQLLGGARGTFCK